MGSLIPFQDLNLFPDHTTASSAATPSIIPKVEPKLEPLDEPLHAPGFANREPGSSLNSQPNTPFSKPDTESNALTQVQDISAEEKNVYSEFYQISELFRSAFAKRLQKYGDVEVLDPDSRAIVPVPEENQLSNADVSSWWRNQRSSELVRVTNLKIEDHRYFCDIVRRTRMVYDSLRIFWMSEEEKQQGLGSGRRVWGDLKATTVMKDRGQYLNCDKHIVGSIPRVYIGDLFFFRMELCVVGLHGQPQAGIDYVPASQSSNGEPIATSVIVSGGYEDDEDGGDVIIYTGHGGRDKHSRQYIHQKLECGNLALERSMHYGIEVRVIRGFRYEGGASGKVYVYDGLYRILESWFDVGKSGFGVYKFKLIRMDNQPEMGSAILRYAQNLWTKPLTVRPMGYVSFDISRKKEKVPVFLFNDIDNDHEPAYYNYLVTTIFPPYAYQNGVSSSGCDCVSGCFDNCSCALRNGGGFAYNQNGILLKGKPVIFECGSSCCCPPTCRNRVSQKGVRNRFEVFRSRETGWGVRPLDLIQAGAFICEYARIVLTKEQAQVFIMNGDSLVYPNRFSGRWAKWGDLSQIFSEYVRPTDPTIPPLDFAMDVSRMRNVACYMSHISSPNVLVQFVLYDHNNLLYPHIMLFAMENIPPLRELSLDYGITDELTGKLPICN